MLRSGCVGSSTGCSFRVALFPVILFCTAALPQLVAAQEPADGPFVLTDPTSGIYYRFAVAGGSEVFAAGAEVQGDVLTNGGAQLQPGSRIDGDVFAVGDVQVHGELTGEIQSLEAPLPLPVLEPAAELRSRADRVFAGVHTLEDARVDDVVFVDGNLRIQGRLSGTGTLIATGDIHFLPGTGPPDPGADPSSRLSILAFGDIRLDPDRSLRAVLYAQRDLLGARGFQLQGAALAGRRLHLQPATRIVFEDFDTEPPEIVIVSPADGAILDTATPEVVATFSDDLSGVRLDTIRLVVDGEDRTSEATIDDTGLTWAPTEPLADGEHTVTITVLDGSDNEATAEVTFRIETTPPSTAPPAPRVDPPTSPTAELFVTLTGTALPGAQVEVVGGVAPQVVATGGDGSFSAQVGLAPDRLNRLFVTTLTTSGDRSPPTPVEVLQDGQPPLLFIDVPFDGAELVSDSISVSGRVSDRLSGFLGLAVTVDGAPAQVVVGIGTNGTFERPDVPLLPGDNGIEVVAVDAVGNRTVRQLTVRRVEPDGPRLIAVSGGGQRAGVNSPLAEPLVVRLEQADGSPLIGKVVTFEVTRSDGRLAPSPGEPGSLRLQALTDPAGEASVLWTLGSDSGCGNNRVTAVSAGVAGTAFFSASADAAPANRILVGSGSDQVAETGGPASEPLKVWVSDGRNEVAGVPVTFTVANGGGQVEGLPEVTVPTDVTGHAEVRFTLGPRAGEQRVQATFDGNPGLPATFVVRGVQRIPGRTTTFTGLVVDNAGRPLGGAVCLLEVGDVQVPAVVTGVDGTFSFEGVPAGPGHLHVDGFPVTTAAGEPVPEGSFPQLAYEVLVIPEAESSLPYPVRLPPLDPASSRVYDGTQDVVLTLAGVEGAEVRIRAGSMRRADGSVPSPDDPAILSLNPVHFDDLPMTMPDGAAPPVAWTLQPAGSTFDPPVGLSLPNMSGLPAGSTMYFLSFDHDTQRFEIVATGRVDADGATMTSDPGSGISKAGWGGFCPPYPNTGDVEVDDLEEAKEELRKDLELRQGTASVVLSAQLNCLAQHACVEGRGSWADGFVSEVLQDVAEHRANSESPADRICRHIPDWLVIPLVLPGLPPASLRAPDACAVAGGFYHFRDELGPGFERHMRDQIEHDLDHDVPIEQSKDRIREQHRGLIDQIAPCFQTIPELSPLAQEIAGLVIPPIAIAARELTLLKICPPAGLVLQNLRLGVQLALEVETTLSREELFIPELAQASQLAITAPGDLFFLSVGSQVQLSVLDPDGNDVTTDPGTEYFLAVGDDNITLSPTGVLTLVGTPNPQAGIPAPFQVYAHNGDRVGVGQFAVVDADSDGDGVVDSAEVALGLDPQVFNGLDSDLDGDGLDDGFEALANLLPLVADTDGDGIPDGTELDIGSDPTDPESNTPTLRGGAVVSVGGRTATTRDDGSFRVPNVPIGFNPVRVVAREERGGEVFYGVSEFFDVIDQDALRLESLAVGDSPPPTTVEVELTVTQPVLAAIGATTFAQVEALLSDGRLIDATSRSTGTSYRSSNPDIATVDVSGQITAVGRGTVFITALNQGAVSVARVLVSPGDPLTTVTGFVELEDGSPAVDVEVNITRQGLTVTTAADGRFTFPGVASEVGPVSVSASTRDALTGDLLLATAPDLEPVPSGFTDAGILVLRPLDRTDRDGDLSPDGLEILLGTDPDDPDSNGNGILDGRTDTDRDGVADWIEVVLGTDPLRSDTDGDGIPDGAEDADADGFSDGFEVLAGCDRRVRRATTVVGRAVDPQGQPLVDVRVELPRTAGAAAPDIPAVETRTDGAGAFELVDVALCPLRVQVRAEVDPAPSGQVLLGASARLDAVVGGTTDLGDVQVRLIPDARYPSRRVITGSGTHDVAIADFNGDSALDLVTANQSGDLSVVEGIGDGSFGRERRVPAGPRPAALTTGDLDGNLHPDVVVADESLDVISVFLSRGDGTFEPEQRFPAGDEPVDVELIDLDGDSVLDAVVANRGSSTRPFTDGDLAVLRGVGDGTFEPRVPFGAGQRPGTVTVADLDADGILDLATVNFGSRDVSLLFGLGGLGFEPEVRLAVGTFPTGLAVEDLDGDGLPDLVVTDSRDDQAIVLLGQGLRGWMEALRLPVGENPEQPSLVDFDGDAVPDLLTRNTFSDDLSLLLGRGDGSFGAEERLHTGPAPEGLAIADIDGDGPLDVATANFFSDDVSILIGNGVGAFDAAPSFPAAGSARHVAAGDLIEDGAIDLITANLFDASLSLLPALGTGAFAAPQLFASPGFPADLAVADLNGDDHLDVVTADLVDDTASVRLGAGDGTFALAPAVPTGAFPVAVRLVDLNGDARPDLVTADANGSTVTVALGNGDGTFAEPRSFGAGAFTFELAVADVDGDGRPDVTTANVNVASLSFLHNLGGGELDRQRAIPTIPRPTSVATADFDGDGLLDLVASHENGDVDTISILLNNRNGGFEATPRPESGRFAFPIFVAAAEVNDDGVPDLVVVNENSNSVSVFRGIGHGLFAPEQRFGVGSFPQGILVADLDGDGDPDLAVANTSSDDVTVLLHRD